MTEIDSLTASDAVAQAAAVRRGDVAPVDLVEAAIRQIERLEPEIGALVHTRFEEARKEAASANLSAPFAGVPLILKDSLSSTQNGIPYFAGNRVLKERPYISPADSPIGARLRKAGFITVAVSKTPELGFSTTTQPAAFGPTCNPWDLRYSVGGSSGGSAAAVMARMAPVATGGDSGGSIRIPASFCGTIGLKPTRGLVQLPEPNINDRMHAFVLTRTVRDTRALLGVLAGEDARCLFTSGARPKHPTNGGPPDLPRLRVGIARTMGGVEAHPDCHRAVDATIPVLERLGFSVADTAPSIFAANDALWGGDHDLLTVGAIGALGHLETVAGRAIRQDEVEPFLWETAHPAAGMPELEGYLLAAKRRRSWAVSAMGWWNDYHLLVLPTVCEPPVLIEARAKETIAQTTLTEMRQMAFSFPFNLTGQPSISLPLHSTAEGMPVGVQLVADMGADDLLLTVAERLEMMLPWNHREPPTMRRPSSAPSNE
ncbi:amidase [Bradyrhizobium sp. WSM3983]|uniref:amidase n=1 Tax=Bradyrhizobium sp. WSM3983 TaxID=1038867 RepID=UPI000409ED73|nr:amidase [Bradyrhizobium sp. WSM3983]